MEALNTSDNKMGHDLLLGGGYFGDDNPLVPCFISVERILVS